MDWWLQCSTSLNRVSRLNDYIQKYIYSYKDLAISLLRYERLH
jgi:hypothetical protein